VWGLERNRYYENVEIYPIADLEFTVEKSFIPTRSKIEVEHLGEIIGHISSKGLDGGGALDELLAIIESERERNPHLKIVFLFSKNLEDAIKFFYFATDKD
jgi:hypothetical protein